MYNFMGLLVQVLSNKPAFYLRYTIKATASLKMIRSSQSKLKS